ncbi:MAG: alanine racemase [Arcobacter sp.]|nr:alanine racemase [Arcobacter sp.]
MAKIVLNKYNYFHNLKIVSEHAGSKEKIAVVLKDNAYGHGLIEIATLANEFGITKAVVRTVAEAQQIKHLFEKILILSDNNLSTYSHSFHIVINRYEDIAKLPKNTNVHLKIDTGMHRNGISINSIEEAIYSIYEAKLNLTGIMTHYRSADELTCEFFWQRSVFRDIKKVVTALCEKLFLPIPAFHSSNSSGLFRFKNFDEDIARVGIAQYGYTENHSLLLNPNLKPVMSLWANKIASQDVKTNQKIGYGGSYIVKKDMKISTYDIGYGDGFLRLNEKHKYTTPKGYEILGRVSMDYVSINSTDEMICIFEDVTELAKLNDTISYEITTTLNPNIKKEIQS